MGDAVKAFVKEPGTRTPDQYQKRVYRLAAAFMGLFSLSLVGIGLLLWHGKLFVGLAQRSNVETLTLAFFIVFFGYLLVLSAPAVPGVARVAYFDGLLRLRGIQHDDREKRKAEALGAPATQAPPTVAVNRALDRATEPGMPFELEIADGAGTMGVVHVDGAALTHRPAHREGSNDLLAYFVHQVPDVLKRRGVEVSLEVVAWKKIDDEATEQYLGVVGFARKLERHLGADELWPRIILTEEDCARLTERLTAVCPALRSESFMPDWEFEGTHKLPLIPEPLGLLSLSRTERRVDPVASMGCAVYVVAAAVATIVIFTIWPPWVPGT